MDTIASLEILSKVFDIYIQDDDEPELVIKPISAILNTTEPLIRDEYEWSDGAYYSGPWSAIALIAEGGELHRFPIKIAVTYKQGNGTGTHVNALPVAHQLTGKQVVAVMVYHRYYWGNDRHSEIDFYVSCTDSKQYVVAAINDAADALIKAVETA